MYERVSSSPTNGPGDDPPMRVIFDAAFAHLVESEENIRDATSSIL